MAASDHEWHAMLNEKIAPVQNDIKQNRSRDPPRSREAVSVLKCPTCKPPRDATQKGKDLVRPLHATRVTKETGQKQTLARKRTNETTKRISREFVPEKREEGGKQSLKSINSVPCWWCDASGHHIRAHRISSRVRRRKAARSSLGAGRKMADWPGPRSQASTEDRYHRFHRTALR